MSQARNSTQPTRPNQTRIFILDVRLFKTRISLLCTTWLFETNTNNTRKFQTSTYNSRDIDTKYKNSRSSQKFLRESDLLLVGVEYPEVHSKCSNLTTASLNYYAK
ncbi:hypothetical protein JTB14_017215 [Gonioctena quinquepunctata]|nr:hypothetical protein JTB14_017215 [Gonioctena quinquepunctata]